MTSSASSTRPSNERSHTDQRFASAAMLVEYITRADVLSGGDSFAELYGRPPGDLVSDRALDDLIEELKQDHAWKLGCRVLGLLQLRSLRGLPPFGTFPADMTRLSMLKAIVTSRAWAIGVLLSKNSA